MKMFTDLCLEIKLTVLESQCPNLGDQGPEIALFLPREKETSLNPASILFACPFSFSQSVLESKMQQEGYLPSGCLQQGS